MLLNEKKCKKKSANAFVLVGAAVLRRQRQMFGMLRSDLSSRAKTRTNIPSYLVPLPRSSSAIACSRVLAGVSERSLVRFT